jgi:hypothetical protein
VKRAPAFEARVQDEVFLPALVAFSETATKVPVFSLKMDR